MDKAPDAFRTISEVADDLDIPQHVLRFWETRFTQIKPMKRSGGRRYYRPDDVDLLKGIRHLLYGEGYTIRGVQRILKEQGIRAVQGIGSGAGVPAGLPKPADDHDSEIEAADEAVADDDTEADDVEIDEAPPVRPIAVSAARIPPVSLAIAEAERRTLVRLGDAERVRLQGALRDLLSCRQMLDDALRRPT